MSQSPEHFADTLLDHSTTDTVQPAAEAMGPTPKTSHVGRSTVLPRIEFDGERPNLVIDQRKRFEAIGHLGSGGVGEVALAQDNDIRRQVALKRLQHGVTDATHLVRFVDEIHTVGKLEHPNIVPIHDVGIDDEGRYYYVMKFVDGETLETIIERLAAGDAAYHRRFTFDQRVEIFLGVLRAIQYAHAQGFIHRDIKPANIMVGHYGEVMVMDWGIARQLRAPERRLVEQGLAQGAEQGPVGRDARFRTSDGALIGTPAYMSPEQARGERDTVDERSDVYSLSVLFNELLSGHHYLEKCDTLPTMLDGVQHTPAPMPGEQPVIDAQGSAPAELMHYARRGMAKDPSARYPSVTAMIDALSLVREGCFPIQCPVTLMKRVGTTFLRTVDKHPTAAIVCLGVTVMGMLGSIASLVMVVLR